MFTAWSLFTVHSVHRWRAGGCRRLLPRLGRHCQESEGAQEQCPGQPQEIRGSHFSTTLATLDISTHCTHHLSSYSMSRYSDNYRCILTMPISVPVYKCGPVSSARGNFPHCLRGRHATILTIAVLLLWAAPVSPHPCVGSPVLARWTLDTGQSGHPCTPFPCTLTL